MPINKKHIRAAIDEIRDNLGKERPLNAWVDGVNRRLPDLYKLSNQQFSYVLNRVKREWAIKFKRKFDHEKDMTTYMITKKW